MKPTDDLEKVIKKDLNFAAGAELHDRMLDDVLNAQEKSKKAHSAIARPNLRRQIMKSPITKLAAAAAVVIAVTLGMYVLTGSFDGASITMAQVRQAMENVNWMQVTSKTGKDVVWYSFASKVQITVDGQGRIIYLDFKGGRKLVWNPGSQDIYQSALGEATRSAGSLSGPFEAVTRMFDSLEAKEGWKVTKGPGTYRGRKVAVWTASRATGESGLASTWRMYIDVEKKLPVAFTDDQKGSDGSVRHVAEIEFKYPQSGPADIYEAGAPRSAPIKPAPPEQPSAENGQPQDPPR